MERRRYLLACNALPGFPTHAFILHQAHRVDLWNGLVEEGRKPAEERQRPDFPLENLQLVLLRQACAERNMAEASMIAEELLDDQDCDVSVAFITLQTLGRTDEAQQGLVDAAADLQGLMSLVNYPYLNPIYFPEIVRILEQQSGDRTFVDGPPYRCAKT